MDPWQREDHTQRRGERESGSIDVWSCPKDRVTGGKEAEKREGLEPAYESLCMPG